MMKKVFLSMMMLAWWAGNINAQSGQTENGKTFGQFNFEASSRFGIKQHGITPVTLGADVQLHLTPRLFAVAAAERDFTLLKTGGTRSNFTDFSIGGGLGYAFWSDKSSNDRLELRLQVLNTIGHADRKHTSYDAGIYWSQKSSRNSIAPLIGLGFRYEQSHTSGLRSWWGPYLTLGIRF